MHGHDIELRIIVHGKTGFHHIQIRADRLVAEGAALLGLIEIQRRIDRADDRDLIDIQIIGKIIRWSGQRYGTADRKARRPISSCFGQSFMFIFRKSSLSQLKLIDRIIRVIGMDAGDPDRRTGSCINICKLRSLGIRDFIEHFHCVNIIFIKAVIGIDRDVLQIQFIIIDLHRIRHHRPRRNKAQEKRNADCHNRGQRKKTASRRMDNALQIFLPGFVHPYHSISEMSSGCGFTSSETTLPERSEITRSPIGQIARLCVMITTVMPVILAVFCNSFRICLPVT